MTLSTSAAAWSGTWTGVETVFPANIPAEAAADLVVRYRADPGLTWQVLTAGTHYRVTIGANRVATLIPVVMPAAPGLVEVTRRQPIVQGVDFVNLANFDAYVHEMLHDQHALRAADARAAADRAPKLPVGHAALDIAPTAGNAGKVATLDATGTLLDWKGPVDIGQDVLAAAQVATASAEAAAAQARTDATQARTDATLVQGLYEIVLDDGDQGDPGADAIDDGDQI